MEYTYRCVLTHEDDGWVASFPQLGGYSTGGNTREEALHEASDLLTALLCDYTERGEEPPEPGDVTELAPVTVVVTPETVEESHYETQAACAELLGVTRARVNALVASGQLESKVFDGRRKVSIESMERWRATERKAGRPARVDVRETTAV